MKKPSKAMEYGRAIHQALLGPTNVDRKESTTDEMEKRAVGLLANVLERLRDDYLDGPCFGDGPDAPYRALDQAEEDLAAVLFAMAKSRR